MLVKLGGAVCPRAAKRLNVRRGQLTSSQSERTRSEADPTLSSSAGTATGEPVSLSFSNEGGWLEQ